MFWRNWCIDVKYLFGWRNGRILEKFWRFLWCDFHTWNAFSWKELILNEFIRIHRLKWTSLIHREHEQTFSEVNCANLLSLSDLLGINLIKEFVFVCLETKKSCFDLKSWFWNVRKFETDPLLESLRFIWPSFQERFFFSGLQKDKYQDCLSSLAIQ